MNPLLAIPSIRDIPAIKKLWHTIPYDKFIVKYKSHKEAYKDIQNYFDLHHEYDTLILSSDDLEITPDAVEILLNDIEKESLLTVSGYCNVDDTSLDTYAVQPLGSQDFTREYPDTTFGAWYHKGAKPVFPTTNRFLQVGFEGFCCQVITRKLFDMIDLAGTPEVMGNFDWNFCRQCHDMGVPVIVDTTVKLYHRRFEQMDRVVKFKGEATYDGYNYLLKK